MGRTRKESGHASRDGSRWPPRGGSVWVTPPGSVWATPSGSASPTPVAHYRVAADRTHLSLAKDEPTPRSVQPPSQGRVAEVPRVGGLHHEYLRRAAGAYRTDK